MRTEFGRWKNIILGDNAMEGATMEKKQEDIESLKAAMQQVKILTDIVAEILKDGQVDIKDVKQLPSLIAESKVLVEALKGVKEEVKDLDSAELKELLVLVLEVSLKIGEKFGLKVD